MKRYKISLTITDEENGEQLAGLLAPHLTGQQIYELTTLTIAGVLIEPEPPVLTVVKRPELKKQPKKKKRNLLRRLVKPPRPDPIPDGFQPNEIDGA